MAVTIFSARFSVNGYARSLTVCWLMTDSNWMTVARVGSSKERFRANGICALARVATSLQRTPWYSSPSRIGSVLIVPGSIVTPSCGSGWMAQIAATS